VVVADSLVAAVDAAEAVVVDIDPFAAIVRADSVDDASMPLFFPDHGSNVVGGRHREPEEDFFGSDEVISSARIVHQRLAPATMEPNGVIAYSDSYGGAPVPPTPTATATPVPSTPTEDVASGGGETSPSSGEPTPTVETVVGGIQVERDELAVTGAGHTGTALVGITLVVVGGLLLAVPNRREDD
jgi:hypothetical protein